MQCVPRRPEDSSPPLYLGAQGTPSLKQMQCVPRSPEDSFPPLYMGAQGTPSLKLMQCIPRSPEDSSPPLYLGAQRTPSLKLMQRVSRSLEDSSPPPYLEVQGTPPLEVMQWIPMQGTGRGVLWTPLTQSCGLLCGRQHAKNPLHKRMGHGIGGYLPIGKAVLPIKSIPFNSNYRPCLVIS